MLDSKLNHTAVYKTSKISSTAASYTIKKQLMRYCNNTALSCRSVYLIPDQHWMICVGYGSLIFMYELVHKLFFFWSFWQLQTASDALQPFGLEDGRRRFACSPDWTAIRFVIWPWETHILHVAKGTWKRIKSHVDFIRMKYPWNDKCKWC